MELEREVFELAKVMLGGSAGAESDGIIESMCVAALDELRDRLREDVSAESLGGSFTRAAATLALSFYIGAGSFLGVESFSAGGLKIKRRNASDAQTAAASLRRQAELMLTGYLKDSGFDFRTVK